MKANAKRKIRRTISLFTLVFLIIIALALNVSAAIQCNATVTVGAHLNITYNSSDGTWTTVYAKINVSSSSTANSTASFVANVSNTSNPRHINLTLGSDLVIEDSNVYSVTGICYGTRSGISEDSGENQSAITSATGVTIDRTAPTAPTSVQPGSVTQTNKTLSFLATVTGTDTT